MTPAEWNSLERGDTIRGEVTYIVMEKIYREDRGESGKVSEYARAEYVVVRSVIAGNPEEWTFIKKGSQRL